MEGLQPLVLLDALNGIAGVKVYLDLGHCAYFGVCITYPSLTTWQSLPHRTCIFLCTHYLPITYYMTKLATQDKHLHHDNQAHSRPQGQT